MGKLFSAKTITWRNLLGMVVAVFAGSAAAQGDDSPQLLGVDAPDMSSAPASSEPAPSENAFSEKGGPARAGEGLFAGELSMHGWGVEEADDGSLILYPRVPGGSTEAGHRPAPASEPASNTGHVVTVRDSATWSVERLADGTLLLYQPQPKADVTAAGNRGDPSARSRPVAEPLSTEAAIDQLQARGWIIRLGGDGSVSLFPAGANRQEQDR